MPRKKRIDEKALIKAVDSGMSYKEIMDKFGLNTHTQLKSLYVDALAKEGLIQPIVPTRRSRSEVEKSPKGLKVNQRGSLVIPRETIDEMGFSIGDTFSVRKSAAGVSLKKN